MREDWKSEPLTLMEWAVLGVITVALSAVFSLGMIAVFAFGG